MVTVYSKKAAAKVLFDVIQSADHFLGQDASADSVGINATKKIVNNTESYRNYLISLRNDAILALDELDISHDHTTPTPDIGS